MSSRTKRLLALAASDQVDNSYKTTYNIMKKSKERKDIPQYVKMFDRGKWEALEEILRTEITYNKDQKSIGSVDVVNEENKKYEQAVECPDILEAMEEEMEYEDVSNGVEDLGVMEEEMENKEDSDGVEDLGTMEEEMENNEVSAGLEELETMEEEMENNEVSAGLEELETMEEEMENKEGSDCVEDLGTMEEEMENKEVNDCVEDLGTRHRAKVSRREKKIVKKTDDLEMLEGDDEDNVTIALASASKHEDGRRRRDKPHCCKFCSKLIIGIGRHITTVHKEEVEIGFILSLTDKDKRKELLQQIEREGDYNYNKEVIATGNGELILVRRPTAQELKTHTYEDYGPCTHCLGFMLKAHLWHHVKYNCKAKLHGEVTSFSVRLGSEALLAAGTRETYSPQFEQYVIGKFVKDDIGKACMKEDLILKYGDFLFQKNQIVEPHQRAKNVRSALRVLMNLYLRLHRKTPLIKSLDDILDPSHFTTIVETVKEMCEYSIISKRDDLTSPSTAIRLGLELNKFGEFVHGIYIMNENKTKEKKVKKFVYLIKSQWNTRVSATARSTLEQRKFNTAELLPLTSDLLKLNQYVKDTCESSRKQLEKGVNPVAYRTLCEALLTRIVLFNKRRSGESAKIKVTQFLERGQWEKETTDELKESLSKTEQDLAKSITLLYTKGKRKDKVPVLLTVEMKELLEFLIKVRPLHGIEKDNPYIFGRPYPANTPLRGHDCLKKMSLNAGLDSADRITGTKLRKYVATVCQLFNLSENETDWVARHLGHDYHIHRQFYRLHESALELTKVSRILLAIDKGKTNKFIGKKLEDINVNEMSDLEEDCEENVHDDVNLGLPQLREETKDEEFEYVESEGLPDKKIKQVSGKNCKNSNDDDYSPDEELSDEEVPLKTKRNKVRRICHKKPWSSLEKTAVLQFFRKCIAEKKGVKKVDAEECIQKNPILKDRTWLNIRDFVRNHIRKL